MGRCAVVTPLSPHVSTGRLGGRLHLGRWHFKDMEAWRAPTVLPSPSQKAASALSTMSAFGEDHACETGRRWTDESLRLVAQLVRLRALQAAPLWGAPHPDPGLVQAVVRLVKRGCETRLLPLCSGIYRRGAMETSAKNFLGCHSSLTTFGPLRCSEPGVECACFYAEFVRKKNL